MSFLVLLLSGNGLPGFFTNLFQAPRFFCCPLPGTDRRVDTCRNSSRFSTATSTPSSPPSGQLCG